MRLRPVSCGRLAAAIVLSLAGCGTAVPSATPVAGSVAIDASLLDHLPAQVDGLDVRRSPESDTLAATDPVVLQFGEAVVTALVVDAPAGEFAYVTLVRLRPDAFSEGLYRSWRDSFDEGACSQAGGLAGRAVARISGREVHIDSCRGGVRTYHVWLGNIRVLVSVSALGERRLGERLVEALRD